MPPTFAEFFLFYFIRLVEIYIYKYWSQFILTALLLTRFGNEVVICPVTETKELRLFVRELIWLVHLQSISADFSP
jgi:hypothetical protein